MSEGVEASSPTLTGRFVEHAARVPGRVAVSGPRGALTFAELQAAVGATARRIADGAPDGAAIVILVEDIRAVTTGFIAARWAGYPVAILDVTAPEAHVRGCLERFGSVVVLAETATCARVGDLVDAPVIEVTLAGGAAAGSPPAPADVDLDAVAFITFTSGSTGRPKGVTRAERALAPTLSLNEQVLGTQPDDVWGMVAPNLGALPSDVVQGPIAGVPVHGFDLGRGLRELPAWVAEHGVTMLPMTRGLVRALAESMPAGARLESLRVVVTGGEPLLPGDIEAGQRIFPSCARWIYAFGMNEASYLATRVITVNEVDTPQPRGLVGPVLEGAGVAIVDDDGIEVPPGEVGEIVVRSDALALGYLGEPELTRERFTGAGTDRTFWSRDLGRILPDGLLEVVGRRDERLKVRNFTIEPEQVEAALLALPGVAEAAVTGVPDASGAPMLVAYLVPTTGARLRSTILRQQLLEIAAPQFVPSVFYGVAELPRTRTGKVNRAGLRDLAAEALAARPPYEAPRGDRERMLAALVSEILQIDEIGRDDDIFDLGADSLDILELFAALSDQLSVELPQQTLLEAPTIARLAERLDRPTEKRGAVRLSEPSDAPPFFCISGRGAFSFGFRPLARALAMRGPWPLYALEAYDDDDAGARSLREITQRRVEAIRAVQPRGPYRLGGYSSGGLMALDVAHQLQDAGEDVDLVVLIDTGAPRSRAERIGHHRRKVRRRWPGRSPKHRFRRARSVTYYTLSTYGLVPRVLIHARNRNPMPGRRARESAMIELGSVLRGHHGRLEPYEGRVLYVHARDQATPERSVDMRDAKAFGKVVTGRYEIATVPGTHMSLLEPGSVDGLARAIADALEQPALEQPAFTASR